MTKETKSKMIVWPIIVLYFAMAAYVIVRDFPGSH